MRWSRSLSRSSFTTTPMRTRLQIAALCSLHLPAALESRTQRKPSSPRPKPPFAAFAACQALLLQREPWQESEFLRRQFQPA